MHLRICSGTVTLSLQILMAGHKHCGKVLETLAAFSASRMYICARRSQDPSAQRRRHRAKPVADDLCPFRSKVFQAAPAHFFVNDASVEPKIQTNATTCVCWALEAARFSARL